MKALPTYLRLLSLLAAFTALCWQIRAEEKTPQTEPAQVQQPADTQAPAAEATTEDAGAPKTELKTDSKQDNKKPQPDKSKAKKKRNSHKGNANEIPLGEIKVVTGEVKDEAVSILGNTIVDGEVSSDAVAILGNTTVNGTVHGDAVAVCGNNFINGPVHGDAVAVCGNLFVNSTIEGDAVAVFGNVQLGPKGVIQGETTTVFGKVIRSDGSKMGSTTTVGSISGLPDFGCVGTYFEKCLLRGRLLGFGEGLLWPWLIAAGHLAFYVFLALVLKKPTEKCIATLEEKPGMSILSALLAFLLTPLLIILLAITGIGAILVPFLVLAIFFGGLYGRAVMHAWLGRFFTRFFGDSPLNHVAFATLVGGVLISLLYCVPVVAFLIHSTLGAIGFGVVVYAVAQTLKREKKGPAPIQPPQAPGFGSGDGLAASAAAAAPFVVPAAIPAETSPVVAPAEPPVMPLFTSPADANTVIPPEPAFAPAPERPAFEAPSPAARPSQATPLASALPRASFKQRMLALLIDLMLVLILINVAEVFTPKILHVSFTPLTFLVPMAIYGAILWKLRATTVGGVIFKLEVVRTDDRPLDWTICIVRGLGAILSAFCLGLGFIWIIYDPEKESWHDKIAGTAVVVLPKRKPLI